MFLWRSVVTDRRAGRSTLPKRTALPPFSGHLLAQSFDFSGSRMVGVVDLFQAFLQDVRVNLSGRNVAVTQHELGRAQIGAALEQVRRERVPQQVGSNPAELGRPAV